jgi:hypothetical protein
VASLATFETFSRIRFLDIVYVHHISSLGQDSRWDRHCSLPESLSSPVHFFRSDESFLVIQVVSWGISGLVKLIDQNRVDVLFNVKDSMQGMLTPAIAVSCSNLRK